jgi:hypothetical protein
LQVTPALSSERAPYFRIKLFYQEKEIKNLVMGASNMESSLLQDLDRALSLNCKSKLLTCPPVMVGAPKEERTSDRKEKKKKISSWAPTRYPIPR